MIPASGKCGLVRAMSRPQSVSEAWAINKRNVRGEVPKMRYLHTIEIVSEYENYEDLERVARDANEGDAILRSWSKAPIQDAQLTEPEREFFIYEEAQ